MGIGVQIHGEAKFYPIAAIEKEGAIVDNVGGWDITVMYDRLWETHRIYRGSPLPAHIDPLGENARKSTEVSGEQPVFTTVYWFSCRVISIRASTVWMKTSYVLAGCVGSARFVLTLNSIPFTFPCWFKALLGGLRV